MGVNATYSFIHAILSNQELQDELEAIEQYINEEADKGNFYTVIPWEISSPIRLMLENDGYTISHNEEYGNSWKTNVAWRCVNVSTYDIMRTQNEIIQKKKKSGK